jgi:hypothetical protein
LEYSFDQPIKFQPMCKKLFSNTFLCILSCLSYLSFAQGENSLSFDGSNDYVEVPAASGQLTASTGISMSCWVYATNPSPNYPNFDGIVGFRNETNFDFYFLHLSTNTVEARYRNGSGTNYDIVIPGFQINTWQHLVMTYSTGSLKAYLNGNLVSTVNATGGFTNTTASLFLGKLNFSPSPFQFGGKLDEVGLWDKALTAAEISCMYNYGHDASSADLKLYYKFNQGTAGGTNTGISSLTDSKGNINGTLSGFALTGSNSNFASGTSQYSVTAHNMCKGDSVLFAGNYYNQAGVYLEKVGLAGACDSFAQLVITLDSVDAGITQTGTYTLQANLANARYQWIDCGTGLEIIGQTLRSFTATANGDYAVYVIGNQCADTSECITISGIGLPENPLAELSIYPNPIKDQFTLTQGNVPQTGMAYVRNTAGATLFQQAVTAAAETKLQAQLAPGVYIFTFEGDKGARYSCSLVVNP